MTEIVSGTADFKELNGENLLPSDGDYKYIHVSPVSYHGVDYPETILIGPLNLEHSDILRSYFKAGAPNLSSQEIAPVCINGGLMKVKNNNFLLTGVTHGLGIVNDKNNPRLYKEHLTPEERVELDARTSEFLKNKYPGKQFLYTKTA